MRRSDESSSGVHTAKDLLRHTSDVDDISPSFASCSSDSPSCGSESGTCRTDIVPEAVLMAVIRGSSDAAGTSRKN